PARIETSPPAPSLPGEGGDRVLWLTVGSGTGRAGFAHLWPRPRLQAAKTAIPLSKGTHLWPRQGLQAAKTAIPLSKGTHLWPRQGLQPGSHRAPSSTKSQSANAPGAGAQDTLVPCDH